MLFRPAICTDGYGSHRVNPKAVTVTFGISPFVSQFCTVYISPIIKYILGVDIL